MKLKNYIKTDNDSEYEWIAMLNKDNSYEIVGSIEGSRVLLYRGVGKQTSLSYFKHLAHKHGSLSATIPFSSLAIA